MGGIATAVLLPPAMAGRFESELGDGEKEKLEQKSPENQPEIENDLGWEDVDPDDYQDTPIVRAAQEVKPAVVGITNRAQGFGQTMERGTGSGVIVDSDGYIITNQHVIEGSDEIVITMGDGETEEAELVGDDPETDLAVLEVDPQEFDQEELPTAEFGDSGELVAGELAIAIGNPLGLEFQQSVTSGVISATDRQLMVGEDYIDLIQTDAAINPGNSGGPLVNALGEVVGINSVKIGDIAVEGMGFALPSNRVEEIVSELIDHGYVERPWLGVVIQEIDPYIADIFDLPVDYGAYVAEIEPNSPAAEAGLESGDILLEFEENEIDSLAKLRNIRDDYDVGDTVELTVYRNGEEMSLDMILDSQPEDLEPEIEEQPEMEPSPEFP